MRGAVLTQGVVRGQMSDCQRAEERCNKFVRKIHLKTVILRWIFYDPPAAILGKRYSPGTKNKKNPDPPLPLVKGIRHCVAHAILSHRPLTPLLKEGDVLTKLWLKSPPEFFANSDGDSCKAWSKHSPPLGEGSGGRGTSQRTDDR